MRSLGKKVNERINQHFMDKIDIAAKSAKNQTAGFVISMGYNGPKSKF